MKNINNINTEQMTLMNAAVNERCSTDLCAMSLFKPVEVCPRITEVRINLHCT